MKNIYLIGYMGSGKSAVCGKLSEMTGMDVIEMDSCISERAGMSVSDIFSRFGESEFRRMESALLKELSALHDLIVSCGGGVPLRMKNIKLMKSSGIILLLTAKPETVIKRLAGDHSRPLLERDGSAEHVRAMLKERMPLYLNAADAVFETDTKTPRGVAKAISDFLEKR